MTECNNIAIFAYSWAHPKQPRLDGYLNQFALTFGRLGIDVDVFLANQYVGKNGISGTNKYINFSKLDTRLRSKKYDLILSVNNALLTSKISSLRNQPVVSLIVDDFNHLFNHDQTGPYDQFTYADKILFSSHEHLKKLEQHNKNVSGRAIFLPTATSVENTKLKLPVSQKKYNISWVASLLDVSGITLLYQQCLGSPNREELLRHFVSVAREGGEFQYSKHVGGESIEALLEEHKWSKSFFEMQIQNLISNESRVSAADKLHKFGLKIFGNPEWISASGYHPKIFDTFQDGRDIASHDEVMDIYNSSKICINIPQIQTGAALPYRVIDILASDALLITNHHPNSDLFTIFGPNCPVITYKDMDELSNLCEYYLSHEAERINLVRQCNQMVKDGFDFKDRCRDILQSVNLRDAQDKSKQGTINYVDSREFIFLRNRAHAIIKSSLKRMVKDAFRLIPLSIRRSLISNLKD